MELAEIARVDSINSRQTFYLTGIFYYSPGLWIILLIKLRAIARLGSQWGPVFHSFFA